MRNRGFVARLGRRRGAAAMLFALLLPMFIGTMALSVDTAAMAVARAQLSTAADAATLAGAMALASTQRLQMGDVWSEVTSAQSQATRLAAANNVLGVGAVLLPNASNLNGGTEDIVVGYRPRPFDTSLPLKTDAASVPYYNTVVVRAARDSTHGGRVPNFFSALWRADGSSVRVGSAAAVVGVSGFRQDPSSSANANCLPITLDKNTYAAMIRGQTTDQFTYNLATNTVSSGPDGITESRLYPVGNGYPGNWGTIKIGVSNNSTSTIGAQIRYGITPAQLATYPGGVIQPDPTTGTIQFEGNPGISAGIKDDLTAIIGKPVRIPIFDADQSGGNGNNLVYTVIAFAPVRILKVDFQGKDKTVIIQPCGPPDDATVVWGGIRNGPVPQQFRIVLIQ